MRWEKDLDPTRVEIHVRFGVCFARMRPERQTRSKYDVHVLGSATRTYNHDTLEHVHALLFVPASASWPLCLQMPFVDKTDKTQARLAVVVPLAARAQQRRN